MEFTSKRDAESPCGTGIRVMVGAKHKVLLVEDDNSLRSSLGMFLEKNHCEVTEVTSAEEGVSFLERGIYDLVVTDLKLHGKDGIWLLKHIRKEFPETRVVLMSGYGDIETAVQALKEGASDFIVKPFTPPSFIERCNAALESQPGTGSTTEGSKPMKEPARFDELVGRSFTVKKMKDMVRMVGDLPTTLLITGESGTGKELIARKVHEANPHRSGAFVVMNCAALSDQILEAELFGTSETGSLHSATKGTIFFDDISAFPPSAQAKILRLLETRAIRPQGEIEEQELDVRFICSTNKDLEQLVLEGSFREDLYYRINVVQLYLEPLRDRIEDIPVFMEYFLEGFRTQHGKTIQGFAKNVYDYFIKYDWPGNVRELRNIVERAVIFCNDVQIKDSNIPDAIREPRKNRASESTLDRIMTLRDMEKIKILETLKTFRGNRATTAKALGIGRNTLWRKLKEYEIEG